MVLSLVFLQLNIILDSLAIDLQQAFDRIPHTQLFNVIRSQQLLDTPDMDVLQNLYTGAQYTVKVGGSTTSPRPYTRGVIQRAATSPALFAAYLEAPMTQFHALMALTGDGIPLRHHPGHTLTSRHRRDATGGHDLPFWDISYADDLYITTRSLTSMTFAMESLQQILNAYGLSIAVAKCQLYNLRNPASHPTTLLRIGDADIPSVSELTSLGAIVPRGSDSTAAIHHRLARARAMFWGILGKLWRSRKVSKHTKLRVYDRVISTLTWGAATWTPDAADLRTLETFHLTRLRYILKAKRRNPTASVLALADKPPIVFYLRAFRLRLYGHFARRVDDVPHKFLLSSLRSLHERRRGHGFLRWRQTVAADLLRMGTTSVTDRRAWEAAIKGACNISDLIKCTICDKEVKRTGLQVHMYRMHTTAGAAHPLPTASIPSTLSCPHCGRVCKSLAGLRSHEKTHLRSNRTHPIPPTQATSSSTQQ